MVGWKASTMVDLSVGKMVANLVVNLASLMVDQSVNYVVALSDCLKAAKTAVRSVVSLVSLMVGQLVDTSVG